MFDVLCCKDGMIAVRDRDVSQLLDRTRLTDGRVTNKDGFLLPACRTEDVLLQQPPLPSVARLTAAELGELVGMGEQWPAAATCYGPLQDKSRNEDSALAAVIPLRNERYAFAAVADGVSTRTFWPERASRLACLIAYKTVRSMIIENNFGNHDFAISLRNDLLQSIKNALWADKTIVVGSGVSPPDWSPGLYRKNIDRIEFWYNSTLLISCLGPREGVAFWLGDGGLEIAKVGSIPGRTDSIHAHLRSTDCVEINSYLSLKSEFQFAGGQINYGDSSAIHVYLATDGVDRTIQRNGNFHYDSFGVSLTTSDSAREILEDLWRKPSAELDNYSIARISWPLGIEAAREEGEDISRASDACQNAGELVPLPQTSAGQRETATNSGDCTNAGVPTPKPSQKQTVQSKKPPASQAFLGTDLQKQILPTTLMPLMQIMSGVGMLEKTHSNCATLDLSDKLTRAAYRLGTLRYFFPQEIENINTLASLSRTAVGKFLDVHQDRFGDVLIEFNKLKEFNAFAKDTTDKFIEKVIELIKSNKDARALSTCRSQNLDDLLRFVSQDSAKSST